MEEYGIISIIRDNHTVGDTIYQYFQYVTIDILNSKYSDLNSAIHTLIWSCLSIVITIRAILSMTGVAAIQLKEVGYSAAWLVVAASLTAPSIYMEYIIIPVSDLSIGLTAFLAGSSGDTGFESINGLLVSTLKILNKMNGELGIGDLLYKVIIFICGGIYLMLYLMYMLVALYAKFALTVMFLFGGIVIQISAFKTFRGVLKQWFVAISKYSVVSIIAALIMVITYQFAVSCLNEYIEYLQSETSDLDLGDGFNHLFWVFAAIGAIGLILMFKVMELTTELTGGVATDMSQSFNAAANAAQASLAPIKIAGSGVKKKMGW